MTLKHSLFGILALAALFSMQGRAHALSDTPSCYELLQESCGAFTASQCDPCTSGTCPGRMVTVFVVNRRLASQSGTYQYVMSDPDYPCAVLQECAPHDPNDPCSGENPCGASGEAWYSSTTINHDYLTLGCP